MTDALKRHWPEYLMEAACLGLFMVSAFTFGTILEHPDSPVHQAIPNSLLRRFLMGLAMGSTAIGIIYSPWGKQSGAHINPSTTLTFFRLGKVATWDAVFYVVFQFIGGIIGAVLATAVLVPAQYWTALWIYFTAPLIGMLSAAEVYVRIRGSHSVACAKLHHENRKRCIFCGKPAYDA